MSIFYDQYVDWEQSEQRIHEITNSDDEHRAISELLDQATHHEIFAFLFSILPDHTHELFIDSVKKAPHDEGHVQFIRIYEPLIDVKIRAVAKDAHDKFFDAIHKRMVE